MPPSELLQTLHSALEDLKVADIAYTLERPAQILFGDYTTNAALLAGKELNQDPKEVAKILQQKLQHLKYIERIDIAGPGFLNFFLTRQAVMQEIEAAGKKDWGKSNAYEGKQVMVEYTDPNLFKPLHIGHLMSNIIGESIARLIESAGGKVIRINYLSDIGLTIAKGVWGLQHLHLNPDKLDDLGKAYQEGNRAYDEDDIAHQEILTINQALYSKSDPELNDLRERGLATSLKHVREICRKLGTTFQAELFESESAIEGEKLVRAHIKDGIFEESEGAIVYKGEKQGLHTRVFINSLGLPTYEAKEVGLVVLKERLAHFDTSITITSVEQDAYFQVTLAAIEEIFPALKGKLLHISHGFLRLTSGKMSSRIGNVITAESLLQSLQEEVEERMQDFSQEELSESAEAIAVGAVKYAVLKQRSGKDIIFDPAQSLSLEGDSGPYIQYAYRRTQALLQKGSSIEQSGMDAPKESSTLERTLIHFPEVLERCVEAYEPHYLTTYITEVAAEFNAWYAKERILDGAYPSYAMRMVQATNQVLHVSLEILGMPIPKRM